MSDNGVDYHMQVPQETKEDIVFPVEYLVNKSRTGLLITLTNVDTKTIMGKASRTSLLSDWFVGTRAEDSQFYLIGTVMYDRVPEDKQVEMIVAMVKARLA